MGPTRRVGARTTLLPEVEADQWADELEAWAFAQETKGVPMSGDAGGHALVAKIRAIASGLRDARRGDDHVKMGELLEVLGSLRQKGLALLSS